MNPPLARVLRAAVRALRRTLSSRTSPIRSAEKSQRTGKRTSSGGSFGSPSDVRARRDTGRPGEAAAPKHVGGSPSPHGSSSAVEIDTTRGLPKFEYEPRRDGDADPGEVVWTWVPYEDDPSVGKDRPVLVLARSGSDVIVAQMSSKDHDRRADYEASQGRYWVEIGTGDWDSKGRVSEVRIDRLLKVGQRAIRRVGGVLDKDVFDEVTREMRALFRA